MKLFVSPFSGSSVGEGEGVARAVEEGGGIA
jgi:hypothetical protein